MPQVVFLGMSWFHDKENTPSLDGSENLGPLAAKYGLFFDKAPKGQLKFVHITDQKINGQRAIKELMVHMNIGGIITMCIGGHICKCTELLPACKTLAEIEYNLQVFKTMNCCTGFQVTGAMEGLITELKKDVWDISKTPYARSKQCQGLMEKKMCSKCAAKLKRVNEKCTSATMYEHNYSVSHQLPQQIKTLNEQPDISVADTDPLLSCMCEDSDNSDPDYEPDVPEKVLKKIRTERSDAEINNTLSTIKSIIKDFAPSVTEPFLHLVECQIRNAKASDIHLQKWDSRFDFIQVLSSV